MIDVHFLIQKSPEAGTTTTIDARASTSLTVSSSRMPASSSSTSSAIQMHLCFSHDQVGLRKPQDNVCELELDL